MSDNQPLSDNRLRSINFLCPHLESKLIVDNIKSRLHVDAGGFLTEVEMISVFSGKTRVDHVRALLDVLKTKDNRAFGSFCTILEVEGYGHWSRELQMQAGLECQDITDSCQLDAKDQDRLLQSRKKAFKPTCEELNDAFEEVIDSLLHALQNVFDGHHFPRFALLLLNRLEDVTEATFTPDDLANPTNLMSALKVIKCYSKFNLEVLDLIADCLVDRHLNHQEDIRPVLDKYKKNHLKPLMEKSLSDLAGTSETCPILQPNELNLAFVLPKSPPFCEIQRAREYLIDHMGIKKVETLRFDFGCVYVLLTITYVSHDLQKLLEEFLYHQKYLMEFGILRVLLVGYWSLDLCDGTVQTLALKTKNEPWEYKSVSSFKKESVCQVHQSIKDGEEDAEKTPATKERPSFQSNLEDSSSVNTWTGCDSGLGSDSQSTDAAPQIMEHKNTRISKMGEHQPTTNYDPPETTDEEPLETSDKDLTELARFLTPLTWVALGRRLLAADDVMAIDANYLAVKEKCYQILYRWRSQNSQSSLTDLLDAARNTGRLGQMCAEIERRIRHRGGSVSKMEEHQPTTDSPETTDKEPLKTTDKDLTELARFLTSLTWMALGRRLLPADDVMAIDANYSAVEEKCYQILYRWRSQTCQSSLTDLLDAARNTGKLGQMCAEIERRIRHRRGSVPRNSTSSPENPIDGNVDNTISQRMCSGSGIILPPKENEEESDVSIQTRPTHVVIPHPHPHLPPLQPQPELEPEPESEPEQGQQEAPEPSPHPVVHLRNIFGYKVFVDILPPKTLKVMLVILVIFWVLEIIGTATTARLLEHVHSSPFECHHKGLIFCLTTSLRALTRCLFPLALTIAFYYVLKERAKGPAIDKLMKELEKKEHSKLLRRVVYIFVDSHLAAQRDNMKVLREMRENLSDDLHAMCITALFSGILLTLPLMELGATNFPHSTYRISGIRFLHIFDTLSHLIRNSFCGLMFAFFFFEIKLKFLISGISKADHLLTGDRELDSKEESALTPNLKEEAEKTVHSLSLDWCIVEIFLQFASGVYTLLLLMSFASGKPFSCGIYVEPDKFPAETAVHWFWFVILLLFFHIISTSVLIIPLVRPVGVVLEILGVLFLFYSFEEAATFAHYLQILYALIPMTYCFWFHLVTIVHEFMFAFYSTKRRHPHFKRLASSTFLLVAMVVAAVASIWNEYNNLSTPGGETKQCMVDDVTVGESPT